MRKKIVWGIIGLLTVVGLIFAGLVYKEYRFWTTPWGEPDERKMINIEEGQSARDIANELKEKGVIDHVSVFLILADLRGIGTKLKAGEYELLGTQTPYGILDILATGYAYRHALVVPEGFTQLDIAKRCEQLGICTEDAFLEECHLKTLFRFVVAQTPDGSNATLEGGLFPDTYNFIKNTPPIKVVDRMVNHFNEKVTEVIEEVNEQTAQSDKTLWWKEEGVPEMEQLHKALVLASIIEKEAKKPADRARMASVFVNRLKKKMPLQSDATVHFAISDWSRAINREDKETDSSYNTYKNPGLPPAPICNPGMASIKAAMMPADTTFLYFITNGDGETIFNSSYNEHVKARQRLRRENR